MLFIVHPNKAGDSFSGSTAWENQVRSRIFLDQPRDDDGGSIDPNERVLSRAKANYARNGETLTFRWHQWAFVREGEMPTNMYEEIAANAQAGRENALFLHCLSIATRDRRAVSHVNGTNYGPRIFAKMIEAKGTPQAAFERAMERLLHLGLIRFDQPLWKGDNRHWRHGIQASADAGGSAPTPRADPRADPCADPAPTPIQNDQNPCADLRALTPLYTTYKDKEAGWPPAAPFDGDDLDWSEPV